MAGKGKLENLRPPWKKGQSGNPNGRPKKGPLGDAYIERLQRLLPEELRLKLGLSENATFADAVADGVIQSAIEGNVSAARELREGTEAKANMELEGPPTEVRFKIVNEKTVRVRRVPDNPFSDDSPDETLSPTKM
jgi:hypothetical protein